MRVHMFRMKKEGQSNYSSFRTLEWVVSWFQLESLFCATELPQSRPMIHLVGGSVHDSSVRRV